MIDKNYLGSITVNLTRNVLNSVRMTPGVVGGGATVTGNNAGSFSISGGGSTTGRVAFLVDGIPNTTAHNAGGVVFIPSIDAVQEIKVHTTMFDAQLRTLQRWRDEHHDQGRHESAPRNHVPVQALVRARRQ